MIPLPVTAAVRSHWVARHGALSASHPADVLAQLLVQLLPEGVTSGQLARVIVVCDTPVGAQALNLARSASLAAGWPADLPAFTIDGQGVGVAGALEMVSQAGAQHGPTVVAAVDLTSVVPPGAATVRDYGQPFGPLTNQRLGPLSSPGQQADRLASEVGISRSQADAEAVRQLQLPPASHRGLVPLVGLDRTPTVADHLWDIPAEPVAPTYSDDGACTATNWALPADGAAAVVVGAGPPMAQLTLQLTGGPIDSSATNVVRAIADLGLGDPDSLALAEPSAIQQLVTLKTLNLDPGAISTPGVLSNGTAPGADYLRLIVDAVHGNARQVIAGAGALGQASACAVTPL